MKSQAQGIRSRRHHAVCCGSHKRSCPRSLQKTPGRAPATHARPAPPAAPRPPSATPFLSNQRTTQPSPGRRGPDTPATGAACGPGPAAPAPPRPRPPAARPPPRPPCRRPVARFPSARACVAAWSRPTSGCGLGGPLLSRSRRRAGPRGGAFTVAGAGRSTPKYCNGPFRRGWGVQGPGRGGYRIQVPVGSHRKPRRWGCTEKSGRGLGHGCGRGCCSPAREFTPGGRGPQHAQHAQQGGNCRHVAPPRQAPVGGWVHSPKFGDRKAWEVADAAVKPKPPCTHPLLGTSPDHYRVQ